MVFTVDEVILEHDFLRVSSVPLLIIIAPLFDTQISPHPEMCGSPEQASHYHFLGP
jgi:hypothetical protein